MQNNLNFYIDGQWKKPNSTETTSVINPSTEDEIAPITMGNIQDADDAVAAAKKAFPSWSATPLEERLKLLERFLEIYTERNDELADIISQEMGAPAVIAKTQQAPCGASHLQDAITAARQFAYDEKFSDNTQIVKEPIGVCALITPWNWPMNQIMLKISPALATGCTVVLKPSELSPFSGMFVAQMIDDAGFPAGVFNLINGHGETVGSRLSVHPDIDMVSFTGSTRAGSAITKAAADTVKRVSLELGGKGANIIFADADDDAVARGVHHCFHNSGQSCNAPTRMLVERSVYDKAVATAKAIADETKIGLGGADGDHIGPVISDTQHKKVQRLIQAGIDDGARLVAGGTGKPEGFEKGYFVRPTVFADITQDMTLWSEEVFGPVLSMTPFDTEEEAITMANDTVYGLTNYVQTTDMDKARRIARSVRSGMVEVNGSPRASNIPFGGYKQSGNGREGGHWGVEDFLENKAIIGWN